MTISMVPPGLLLILGGLLLPLLPRTVRATWILAVPLVTLGAVWLVPDGVALKASFLDYTLEPVQGDALSRLFGTIFSIMALIGGLFALRQRNVGELAAALVYAGGAVGATFAGDLITLFVFWEIMAVASAVVIWFGGTPAAYRAGMRYVMIHLLGGVVLMAGIAAHVLETGSVDFAAMELGSSVGTWLMIIGMLVNAGAPPLSAWVADAYPEASWSGTVFLSAFTTKTAVYVLMRGFPGTELLIWVGLYMVFYGIVYALLENDIRRILAYSIVNQVGFMLAAIGIGTEMALNGAAGQAFVHVLYKGLLMMTAGAVLYQTGERKATELGGLAYGMPLTTACAAIGSMTVLAVPLTAGFAVKPFLTAAAAEAHLTVVWFLLVAGASASVLHAGLKFLWFTFFQQDSGKRPTDPPRSMQAAMVIVAVLCLGLGIWPTPLYAMLPFPVTYQPYTAYHVVEQVQLVLFSAAAFFILLPLLKRTRTITLDWDWFYRRFYELMDAEFTLRGGRARASILGTVQNGFTRLLEAVEAHHGPRGILARTWALSSAALWVVGLLGVYLLLYYI